MRAICSLLAAWFLLWAGVALAQQTLLHSGGGGAAGLPVCAGTTVHLTAPNDFTNAAWVKSNVTAAGSVSDPLGGTAASSITTNSVAGGSASTNVKQALSSIPANQVTSFSAYFKSLATPVWGLWQISDDTSIQFGSWINLSTGAFGNGNSITATLDCTASKGVTNGWVFFSMAGHSTGAFTPKFELYLVDGNGTLLPTLNQAAAGFQMSP